MTIDERYHPFGMITSPEGAIARKCASHPLALPPPLLGAMPAPAHQPSDDVQQVRALGDVITFLTSTWQHGFRSVRPWESDRRGRGRRGSDSQDRMDRITMMATKAKDFVNAAAAATAGLGTAKLRSRL